MAGFELFCIFATFIMAGGIVIDYSMKLQSKEHTKKYLYYAYYLIHIINLIIVFGLYITCVEYMAPFNALIGSCILFLILNILAYNILLYITK